MGVVYRARDQRLKRQVALKVMHAHRSERDAVVRFRAEAETVAKLAHPNIVQIYEVGEHEGLPYLALELFEGGTLADLTKGEPLPFRQAAEILAALAGAIDYAHQNGVVHRDLKPKNVLLTSLESHARDSTLSSRDSTQTNSATRLKSEALNTSPGLPSDSNAVSSTSARQSLSLTPKVADFGLAKDLELDNDLTRTGTIMGTPNYMSPEQARGDIHEVGPAADIYSLGAVLYALVTGRPPFVGENYAQTISMVVDQELLPPTRLQPRLPRDLETICLKCLAKQSGKRYGSAGELAEDLQRFLSGRPILARPIGPLERVAKFIRRRPALAAVIALVASIAMIGAPAMTALYMNSEFHRKAAVKSSSEETKAKDKALESERAVRQQVARLRAAQGVKLMREGKLFESLIWTASAWESESQLRVERSDVESHSEKIQRYRFAATLQQCPALVASWKLQNPPPWSGRPTGFSFDASGQFVSIEGNVFMLGQPGESLEGISKPFSAS